MCGRFTDQYTWAEIYEYYNLLGQTPTNWGPSFNVCPTDDAGGIVEKEGHRKYERMRWGLVPRWWSKSLKESTRLATFNARAETVRTKPFFREAFKNGRCLMPVSGYFEWHWTDPNDKKEKPQPWHFTRNDGQIITVAALYETWKDRAEDRTVRSCAMVITEPNKFVAEVHDRMPVILEPSQFDQWINGTPDEAAELMKPASEDLLRKWPVSKRINSSKAPKEDSTLIQPA